MAHEQWDVISYFFLMVASKLSNTTLTKLDTTQRKYYDNMTLILIFYIHTSIFLLYRIRYEDTGLGNGGYNYPSNDNGRNNGGGYTYNGY